MKVSTILIYATLILYANTSLSHERNDIEKLQEHVKGSLKNIIIKKETTKLQTIKLVDFDDVPQQIFFKPKKVTLINFWATWCAPCREEMPSLNKLVTSVGSDAFSVIAIAAGRNSKKVVNKFFLDHKLSNLKSFKDPKGKVASKLNVLGLPTTIIVDQHSNELARLIGDTNWNSKEAIDFINYIIEHDN